MCDYLCNNQDALFFFVAVYLLFGTAFSIYNIGIVVGGVYEGKFPKDARRILRALLVFVLIAIFWLPLGFYERGKTEGKKKREDGQKP